MIRLEIDYRQVSVFRLTGRSATRERRGSPEAGSIGDPVQPIVRWCICLILSTYPPQHLLYFLPLPHGQGSFRPVLACTLAASGGLRSRSTSEISSGLFGSMPTITFQPLLSQMDRISPARFCDFTRATNGLLPVPSLSIIIFPHCT